MAAYPSTTTCVSTAPTVVAPAMSQQLVVIEKTFDLDALLSAKVANADIVNLMTLPANFCVIATLIKTTVIAVGCSGTCTAKLRHGTTDIGATADILTTATATGGGATVSLPLNVGTSSALLNLVFAIGAGTTTTNPTIKVTIVGIDMN
jgi:hypothetical protein